MPGGEGSTSRRPATGAGRRPRVSSCAWPAEPGVGDASTVTRGTFHGTRESSRAVCGRSVDKSESRTKSLA
jgi:hypothetical protein